MRCRRNHGQCKNIHFDIVKDEVPSSLLSGHASEALKLTQFNTVQSVNIVVESLTKEAVMSEYGDVFKGLGKLPGYYHIDMDNNVKPVQNTRRRVPISVRPELEKRSKSLRRRK